MKESELVFGIRAVIEAIQADKEIDKILVRRDLQGELAKELFETLRGRAIQVQRVPQERLDRYTRKNHQGVIAFVSAITYQKLEDIIPLIYEEGRDPFIVLLDGITDVRNFGAIARTLECAGGNGIIVPAKGGAAINADAIKVSAGALMRIGTCRVPNLKIAAYYLRQSGFRIVAATEKSDRRIYDADMTGPCAVIMGSEGKGISPAMLSLADDKVSIPMEGEISSLNVSAAASVALFEAVRQRLSINR